jgi:GTPase SAR1 family protein
MPSLKIAIFVYSAEKAEALERLRTWIENLKRDFQTMPAVVVIGNKIDLRCDIVSSASKTFAEKHNPTYVECNALTRKEVRELFIWTPVKAICGQGSVLTNESRRAVDRPDHQQCLKKWRILCRISITEFPARRAFSNVGHQRSIFP